MSKREVSNFDPLKPTCPSCGRRLRTKIEVVRYEDDDFEMWVYVCKCRAWCYVVVMDDPKPGETYIVEDITNEDAS